MEAGNSNKRLVFKTSFNSCSIYEGTGLDTR